MDKAMGTLGVRVIAFAEGFYVAFVGVAEDGALVDGLLLSGDLHYNNRNIIPHRCSLSSPSPKATHST